MVASGWGWKYPIYGDKMYSEVSILLTNRSARAIRVRFEPAPFYEGIRSIPAGETGIAWSGNEDQLPEGLVFVIIGARDERELERLRVEGLPKRGFPDGKAKEWTLVYDEPRGR